jgi:DNA-binding MarR family transcriptional regulator
LEIRARTARRQFFKASLFSDPAWDILLELFAAEQEGRRVAVSTVGLDGNIPQTTALRWINALKNEGLVERRDDPLDARRSFLSLSDSGLRAMTLYFQSCGAAIALS